MRHARDGLGRRLTPDGEEGVENKQEDCGDYTTGFGLEIGARCGQDGHGTCLTNRTEEHQLPSAELFNGKDSHPGCHEVFGTVASCQKTA